MSLILIVDDRLSSRQVLTTLLGYYQYHLIEASDGVEALDVARVHRPDLIIADVLMPTMDGFELVRRLRLETSTALIPVIFYTASYLEKEARQLAASCGVSHILLKPSDPEVIIETVKQALGESVPAVKPLPVEEFRESHLHVMAGKLSEVVPRLAALIEIGQQLIGEHDLTRLVEEFLHSARDVIGAKHAAVGLLGEDRQTFSTVITSGISHGGIAEIGHFPTGRGVLARAIRADKPFRLADITADPEFGGFPPNHPHMHSFLGAPIRTLKRSYGAFYFTDKIGAVEFNEEDERVAATLATQIALACENAHHYSEIQREIAERRQTENALRESEQRYRSLFKNVPVGLYRSALDGTVLDANPMMLQILGVPDLKTPQEVNFADLFVIPETRNHWMANRTENGVVRDFEALLRRSDGETVWCLINARGITNGEGQIQHFEGSVQNINERKQAQEELNALYNALSILFQADSLQDLGQQIVQAVVKEFRQADCGLLLLSKDRKEIVRVARGGTYQVSTDVVLALDGLGLVPEALRLGKPVYAPDVMAHPQYLANDPRTRSELVMPLSTAQGIIGVLDLQSPEMHAFSKRDQRILTAFGERAAAALETMQLYEEVNRRAIELERRVAERTAQLQQTTERIEAILNNSSDAIIVLQPDGTITNTNPAFSAVFGYTSDAVLKQPLAMLFESQENNSIIEALHSVVGGQSSVRSEIVARRADGATFYADSLFSPIKEANNKIVGIVCSLRDITARKNMEADLRVALAKEKELGELKSRFASMVSHEFRTPLATIQALIETLSAYRHKLPDDQIDERLDKIKDQVGNLKDIMEDVLLLARMQSRRVEFNPAKVDLDALCRSVLDEFLSHTDTKHQLVYVCNDDLHEVMLDRKLMRQIIGNVLSNAIKYSPEGKTVYVNLEHVESAVILKVRDEGIGIPQADLKHLFEPFHRAANVGTISGTGLGLVIVKEVTELHGGTIAVESQVNVGTTFTIRIPISITGDDDDENSGD